MAMDKEQKQKVKDAKIAAEQQKEVHEQLSTHAKDYLSSFKKHAKKLEADSSGKLDTSEVASALEFAAMSSFTMPDDTASSGYIKESIKSNKDINEEQFGLLNAIRISSEDSDKLTDAFSKTISSKLGDMAKNVSGGDYKTLKADNKQLQLMKDQLKEIRNPDEKLLLEKQVAVIENLQNAQGKGFGLLQTGIAGVKDNLGDLTAASIGIFTGLLGDSGLAGIAAAGAAKFVADKIKARRDDQLAAEEMKREDIFESAKMQKSEDIENALELINDNADILNQKLIEKMGTLGQSTEEKNEAIRREEELIASMQTENTERDDSKKEKGKGLLSKIFSALVGGVMTTLATGMVAMKAFGKQAVGKIFKGLKFILRKLPIIGPLITGGMGVFDALNDLPDDATIGTKIMTGIMGAAEGIMDWFLGIPVWLIDTIFGTDIGTFVDEKGGFVEMIAGYLNETLKKIGDFFGGVFDSILNWVEEKVRAVGGDMLASAMGFEKENEQLSNPALQAKITEKEAEIADAPSTWGFVKSIFGADDQMEKFAELEDLKRIQNEKFSQQAATERDNQGQSQTNVTAVNQSSQTNVSTPTTNYHIKQKPQNNDMSLSGIETVNHSFV